MAKAIHIPERHSIVAFVSPDVWSSERDHALSESRKDKKLRDDELKYHAVDVAGIRLYLLEFPKAKMVRTPPDARLASFLGFSLS